MDFIETDELRLIRKAAAAIADRYGPAYFLDAARQDTGTSALWSELAASGFIGVNTPVGYGGGGGGMQELAAVAEETAAAGTPLVLLMVSPAICATLVAAHGTEQQKTLWLPLLAEGQTKMGFALTEPDAGSNSHAITTTAVRADDGSYRLSGTKYYISGADESAALIVVARTRTAQSAELGTSLFLVRTDAPGVSLDRIRMEIIAPENQYYVRFDDVRLDESALLGDEGDGLRTVFTGLNPERIICAAIAVGLARYALAKAAQYAQTRVVFGRPIGANQSIAHPLALARVHTDLAALMVSKAAWQFDNGVNAAESSNAAKLSAADAALESLDAAVQTLGGNGLTQEYELAAYWGLARLFKTAPVSREMVLNHVSQHSLRLPKSY